VVLVAEEVIGSCACGNGTLPKYDFVPTAPRQIGCNLTFVK
jgi:hypothetical protein